MRQIRGLTNSQELKAPVGDLKVISRTSVMEYRDTTKNLRQIGTELGVASIMEGAIQRSGKQVRINVQLPRFRRRLFHFTHYSKTERTGFEPAVPRRVRLLSKQVP